MHKRQGHLVVVSHTEHYRNDIGRIAGWGATVRELDEMAEAFEKVTHVACLLPGQAPPSALSYTADNIEFKKIPPFGGNGIIEKLGILWVMPRIIRQVRKTTADADAVQLRLPTGMGVFLLPYFSIAKRKYTLWVKYAGNWKHPDPPLGYRIILWWLKKDLARCKVTINGEWDEEEGRIYSFENPCIDAEQFARGEQITLKKSFIPPFNFTLVGRIEKSKGVDRFLNAVSELDPSVRGIITVVGDGSVLPPMKALAENKGLAVRFTGHLPPVEVHRILQDTHFIVAPSDPGEGFPKVLAEGANYGAIPIASAISAVPHICTDLHDALLWHPEKNSFASYMKNLDLSDSGKLQQISANARKLADRFTFAHYRNRILKEILELDA